MFFGLYFGFAGPLNLHLVRYSACYCLVTVTNYVSVTKHLNREHLEKLRTWKMLRVW